MVYHIITVSNGYVLESTTNSTASDRFAYEGEGALESVIDKIKELALTFEEKKIEDGKLKIEAEALILKAKFNKKKKGK